MELIGSIGLGNSSHARNQRQMLRWHGQQQKFSNRDINHASSSSNQAISQVNHLKCQQRQVFARCACTEEAKPSTQTLSQQIKQCNSAFYIRQLLANAKQALQPEHYIGAVTRSAELAHQHGKQTENNPKYKQAIKNGKKLFFSYLQILQTHSSSFDQPTCAVLAWSMSRLQISPKRAHELYHALIDRTASLIQQQPANTATLPLLLESLNQSKVRTPASFLGQCERKLIDNIGAMTSRQLSKTMQVYGTYHYYYTLSGPFLDRVVDITCQNAHVLPASDLATILRALTRFSKTYQPRGSDLNILYQQMSRSAEISDRLTCKYASRLLDATCRFRSARPNDELLNFLLRSIIFNGHGKEARTFPDAMWCLGRLCEHYDPPRACLAGMLSGILQSCSGFNAHDCSRCIHGMVGLVKHQGGLVEAVLPEFGRVVDALHQRMADVDPADNVRELCTYMWATGEISEVYSADVYTTSTLWTGVLRVLNSTGLAYVDVAQIGSCAIQAQSSTGVPSVVYKKVANLTLRLVDTMSTDEVKCGVEQLVRMCDECRLEEGVKRHIQQVLELVQRVQNQKEMQRGLVA